SCERADSEALFGALARPDQGENRGTVRRDHRDPAAFGVHRCIDDKLETQLVDIKPETFVLIADIHQNAVDAEVRLALGLIGLSSPRLLIAPRPIVSVGG